MVPAIDTGNQVWARVRTSHDTGTVIEVDVEKYLVDLDGQAAQLWEKAWGLRKGLIWTLRNQPGI